MRKENISTDVGDALAQQATALGAGERLTAVAALVRNGARLSDVGTDHALIPIMLTKCGTVRHSVASDIAQGPISRARAAIAAHGLTGMIDTELTPGLCGIERHTPDDIVIAGMGGLTIIGILSESEYQKNDDVHLILQPMQHAPQLRIWLGENGYETEREVIAREDDKIYQIMSVRYTGVCSSPDAVSAKLGAYNIEHRHGFPHLFAALCDRYLAILSARITGLRTRGDDTSDDEKEYNDIMKLRRMQMTVGELYNELNTAIPRALSCDWDNDGLMICADAEAPVKRVLLSLDATDTVCDYAIREGYDLIITHHPVIFRKIGNITDGSLAGGKAISLIRAGVSVMSFHTRFDCCDGGINDILAEKLGLENTEKLPHGTEAPMARIGNVDTTAVEFCERIKKALGSPVVLMTPASDKVHRVAVCGGDGRDFMYDALRMGADTYITGRAGYNVAIDMRDEGLTVIEAGHYYTEAIFTDYFEKFLSARGIPYGICPVGCEIKNI